MRGRADSGTISIVFDLRLCVGLPEEWRARSSQGRVVAVPPELRLGSTALITRAAHLSTCRYWHAADSCRGCLFPMQDGSRRFQAATSEVTCYQESRLARTG